MMTRRQTNLHLRDLPNQAITYDFGSLAKGGLRPLPGTSLPDAVIFSHCFYDSLLLCDGAGQRLFTVDIFLISCCFSCYERMPCIRHGQHDRIDIGASHYLAIIMIWLAVLISIVRIDLVERRLEIVLVDVTGGNHLAILLV